MLKQLTDYPDVITIVPNSGIQMLDFGLSTAAVSRVSLFVWPEVRQAETDPEGRPKVRLHPLEEVEDGHVFTPEGEDRARFAPEEEVASYNAVAALDIFDGEWLPAPFLRRRVHGQAEERAFDSGPLGWCRARVAKLDSPDEDGNTHRVTLAFDTTLGADRRDGVPYLAPEPRDATDPVEFQLVTDAKPILFFLEAEAVRRWLRDRFVACLSRKRRRTVTAEQIEPGEFWAQYLAFLAGIGQACRVPRIKLIDTVSAPQHLDVIDVDLVIDVGNSRTCGVLIERSKGREQVDITQSIRLELRDLTRPEFSYSDPFETWVEFSPASFGSASHARRIAQKNAFWWPSLVRVGPEALWLAAKSDGTEGITGLSSPKRYLWDVSARPHPWANTRGLTPPGEDPPEIKGPMVAELTERGDLISDLGGTVGTSPRYSRSSLYTLMLVELLSHAIVQINAAGLRSQRTNRDLPRRLSTVILTLPSATPLAEQKALRKRTRDACQLLWRIMRWEPDDPLHKMPTVLMDWDEATCTHLVYLHNEVNWKYQGQPSDLFAMLGRGRMGTFGGPAVRIASIDIGGGTTDLMIIQHEVEGKRIIHPRQVFREGFRLAGDDIVKTVIEDCVLPRFSKQLEDCGVNNAPALLTDLFGGDREGISQQDRTLRAMFVSQVFTPIAIGLLGSYERTEGRRSAAAETFRVRDLIRSEHMPQAHVRAYLEREAERRGAQDFTIDDVVVTMEPARIAASVNAVIGTMLDDLSDLVRAYNCDLLLLSGRPSRLPVVRERIHSRMPLPPYQVVAMHRYEVFNWYPFRSSDFRISDPKTTAAVGAMLCLVCAGRHNGFFMHSDEIKMRSTARFLGVMNQRGEITDDNVLLENVDLDTGSGVVGFDVRMEGPTFIGFRQLPLARWKTTPLYYLSFRNPDRLSQLRLPITARFERRTRDEGSDEAVVEDFKLQDAVDADGTTCTNQVLLRLQTLDPSMQAEAGYWLDSGVLHTAQLR